MAAIRGRVVLIKRYPNECMSFLTITIGGVKRVQVDDFVTLRPYIKEARPQADNTGSPKLLSQLRRIRIKIGCGGKLARLNAIDELDAVIAQLRASA